MARLLKFISFGLLIGWFVVLVTVASAHGPRFSEESWMSWFASVALLNNFTAAILIGVPVLVALAPVMLLSEWLWEKGDKWETHGGHDEPHQNSAEVNHPAPPLSHEEMATLKLKTEEGTQRTKDYLHAYFGPNGPSRPKPRARNRKS